MVAAGGHDFAAFAACELSIRKELGYPPYGHLVAFKISGEDDERARGFARTLGGALGAAAARPGAKPCSILGPGRAPLEMLRGRYRWQVMVKGTDRAAVRGVALAGRDLALPRLPPGVRLAIDVDPIHML